MFAYLIYQSLKDAEPTAGLNGLRIITIVTALAYLLYQTLKNEGPTEGLTGLRNITIVTVLAYFQYPKDAGPTEGLIRLLNIKIVTVLAYINYFQSLSTEDEGPITRCHTMRKDKGTKSDVLSNRLLKMTKMMKIAETQAGSE